jgi:hypothetical protein
VDFKTTDESWDISPLTAKIWFNGGFIGLLWGDALLQAFESDTIWTSNDPYRLVGDVGIYRYNVGYERKGFSFESQEDLKTRLRAMYTDKIEERLLVPVTIPSSAFGGFQGSSTPDTLVYRYDGSLSDEDTWAFELVSDLGSLDFGYANRWNRGMHPGLLTDVTRGSGDFELVTFNTREYWGADALWLRWGVGEGFALGGGYGHSEARIRQTARSVSTDTTLGDVGIGQDTKPFDSEIPLQSSKRWDASIAYDRGRLTADLTYRWNQYDFDPFVYQSSRSEISTIGSEVAYKEKEWSATAGIHYIDQDYGDTPADFHYFTPARNFWLDWGDRLDVGGQVEFDMPRATDVTLTFGWHDRAFDLDDPLRPVAPLAFLVTTEAVTYRFFEDLEYVAGRFDGEYGFTNRVYLDAHARVARYDKPSWQVRQTYFAYYLEAGYRNDRLQFSLGVGPDPVVLDPVPNVYRNNGWEQALRQSIPADLTRNQSQALGQGLQTQERLLEDDHAITLELILFF